MFGNEKQSFEVFSSPDHITALAGKAIPGSRFVKLVTGGTARVPKIELCGAGERPFGVSAYSVAAGEKVTVHRKGVWTVDAGEALVAPAAIASGADGTAVTAADVAIVAGQIYTDATLAADAAVVLAL